MRRLLRAGSLALLLVLLASAAPALQAPGPADGPAVALDLDGADVITASDYGGGYLTASDILLIIVLALALVGLAALL